MAIGQQSDEELIRQVILLHVKWKDSSYLYNHGWFESVRTLQPVNLKGESIPWISYPAFDFIRQRIFPRMKIFEYGCGHSTVYWINRGAEVVSVEHDAKWFEAVKNALDRSLRLQIYHRPLGEGYSDFASNYEKVFDMVVIDGRERNACCRSAIKALNDSGVILFDDSSRERYDEGRRFLKQAGFREIEFYGMSAETIDEKKTSIFYRSDNCLNI